MKYYRQFVPELARDFLSLFMILGRRLGLIIVVLVVSKVVTVAEEFASTSELVNFQMGVAWKDEKVSRTCRESQHYCYPLCGAVNDTMDFYYYCSKGECFQAKSMVNH